MANYYAYIRTNYFRVKDEKKFREFMARVSGTEDRVELWEEKDKNGNTVFGFGTLGGINGITLNGLEYLQDEDGVPICFEDRDAAQKYLHEHGVTDVEMEDMEFRESNGTCRFCGSPLFPSDVEGYTYQCFQCDEDF